MIQLAVGMAVGIILIVGLIWPIVDDSTSDIVSKSNNASINYVLTDDDVDLDYTVDDGKLYVNGELVNLSGQHNIQGVTNGFAFTHAPSWSNLRVSDLNNNIYNDGVSSVSISNGSFTYVSGGSETSGDMGTISFMPSNHGNYGAFFESDVVNVTPGNAVYMVNAATGIFTSDNVTHRLFSMSHMIDGTIYNDYAYIYDGSTFNEVDLTVTYNGTMVEENGYISYQGTSVSYSVDGYETVTNAPSGILAPIEYLEITDMDSNIRTMIGVAGMLIVVLMVVMVARNLMD